MATIRLYGHLKKKFGAQFDIAIASPAEAIRALMANFPSFRKEVEPGKYSVLVDEAPLLADDLSKPMGAEQTIHIMPLVAGAKDGLFGVIAGVALIAAAVFVPGLQGLAAWAVGGLGAALAMGGMSSMMTPTTNTGDLKQANRIENKYFRSPENVEAQGRAIPLIYGLYETGSLVISSSRVIE